jgi:hypothetical protein
MLLSRQKRWLDEETEMFGTTRSTPLPQLFPHLNKGLHLAWAWKIAIDEAAILICLLVEVPHGWQTEVREIVPKFRKVFLAQHLSFSLIRTPRHRGRNFTLFRLVFAMALCYVFLSRKGVPA